jgi:hypothetical protein
MWAWILDQCNTCQNFFFKLKRKTLYQKKEKEKETKHMIGAKIISIIILFYL